MGQNPPTSRQREQSWEEENAEAERIAGRTRRSGRASNGGAGANKGRHRHTDIATKYCAHAGYRGEGARALQKSGSRC